MKAFLLALFISAVSLAETGSLIEIDSKNISSFDSYVDAECIQDDGVTRVNGWIEIKFHDGDKTKVIALKYPNGKLNSSYKISIEELCKAAKISARNDILNDLADINTIYKNYVSLYSGKDRSYCEASYALFYPADEQAKSPKGYDVDVVKARFMKRAVACP